MLAQMTEINQNRAVDEYLNTRSQGNRIIHSHNIRVWLYKRHNRFLYNVERDYTLFNHPFGINPSSGVWLGIAQYSRYLVWIQRSFEVRDIFFGITNMVFHDAHAATSSILSSNLDRIFFDNCRAERVIMVGTNTWYKSPQHVHLDDVTQTLHVPDPPRHFRIGWLAGAIIAHNWYAREGDPLIFHMNVPEITQPFDCPLNANFRPIGPSGVPPSTAEADYPTSGVGTAYWGYGLDEHIVTYIPRRRASNEDFYGSLRLLNYNINWFVFQSHWDAQLAAPQEYYREIQSIILNACYNNPPGQYEPGYFERIMDFISNQTNVLGRQVFFETLYGNVGNVGLRVRTKQTRYANGAPIQQKGIRFTQAQIVCRIYQYSRYDRFDYYHDIDSRILSDGTYRVLTNHNNQYIDNMILALQEPIIDIACGSGVDSRYRNIAGYIQCPDDARLVNNQKCGRIAGQPNFGGYRKNTRRKKSKSYKKTEKKKRFNKK
jgi:hypothetical protein